MKIEKFETGVKVKSRPSLLGGWPPFVHEVCLSILNIPRTLDSLLASQHHLEGYTLMN